MGAAHRKQADVRRVLQGRILRGAYSGKLPGLRQLATELGTSTLTVSVATARLESLGLLRAVPRKGIFVVPPGERRTGSQCPRARLVVAALFDAEGHGSFWASAMIYGFQKAARERDVHMELEYSTDIDQLVEETIAESARDTCVGTCLLGVPVETRHVIRLSQARGPLVVADRSVEEPLVPLLNFDDLDAGQRVARHLSELGHRCIALPAGDMGPNDRLRLKGIREYWDIVGGTVVSVAPHNPEYDMEYLQRLVRQPLQPTALVCNSLQTARAFRKYAGAIGLRIPEDLSLAAFGDGKVNLSGEVTHAELDNVAFGRRAFEMLFDEELQTAPRAELFPVVLVKGRTTGPPR